MPIEEPPVLIGCAHGTRDPAGRRAMARLRLQLTALRPGLTVLAASVDVQKPALPDVVARLRAQGRRAVVVPLLLSAGYHVYVDVAEAVAASDGLAVASAALGPDPALVDIVERRLLDGGARPGDHVVLAAAGSSDPRAVADVEVIARGLQARRGTPVTAAYLSAALPTVVDAVADSRTALAGSRTALAGSRTATAPSRRVAEPAGVTIATYLLAPGFFVDRLASAGADRVSAPLAPDPQLAALALRRYDEAVAAYSLQP